MNMYKAGPSHHVTGTYLIFLFKPRGRRRSEYFSFSKTNPLVHGNRVPLVNMMTIEGLRKLSQQEYPPFWGNKDPGVIGEIWGEIAPDGTGKNKYSMAYGSCEQVSVSSLTPHKS